MHQILKISKNVNLECFLESLYANFKFIQLCMCLLQSLYNMLGEAHYRLNEFAEAERWYKAALQAKPDHVPAHLTYGKMLAKNVSKLPKIAIVLQSPLVCVYTRAPTFLIKMKK